jgi:hypothetical protein
MSRLCIVILQLVFGTLTQLVSPAASGCKPCADPSLAGLVGKADIVAVAEVVKVAVMPRPPDPQAAGQRLLQDVRWQVKVARGVKGNPPRELNVSHGDQPPCISAIVPQPGRYLMLLYHRDGQYIPLNYCEQPLFPIDAQDRVELPRQIIKELRAPASPVPLNVVLEAIARLITERRPPS